MKYIIGLILLVSFTGCASARPWTTGEKVMAGASILASFADAYTTCGALNNPNNSEANPIMGKRPSNGRVIVTIGLSELIALGVSHWYPVVDFPLIGKVNMRYGFLGMKTVINTGCAINNSRLDWD